MPTMTRMLGIVATGVALACSPPGASAVPALGVSTSIDTPQLPLRASTPDATERNEEAIRERTHLASQETTPSSAATDYTTSAAAFAEYGRIGASASVYQSIPSGFQSFFGSRADLTTGANARAGFTDLLTLDVGGRTGETVDLTISTGLNGSVRASPGGENGSAGALLRGSVDAGTGRQSFANALQSTAGDSFDNSTPTVEIVLGEAFSLNLSLTVDAFVARPPGVLDAIESSASANFGSTAYVTGFELSGLDGARIEDYTLTSASGRFAFFDPEGEGADGDEGGEDPGNGSDDSVSVPEPSTAMLLALALIGAGVRRSSQAVL